MHNSKSRLICVSIRYRESIIKELLAFILTMICVIRVDIASKYMINIVMTKCKAKVSAAHIFKTVLTNDQRIS